MQDDYSEMKAALSSLRSNAYNIQTLLRMAQRGQLSSEVLGKITQSIENHFNRVESLEIDIPEKNKEEHREILWHFSQIREDWKNGVLSDVEYAEYLNCRLFNHFSICFQPLLDTYLDVDPQFEFKV